MSLFTSNDKVRKSLVVFRYITRYCPKALREMTKVSVANNVRYNPDRDPTDINWARDKSKDQLGSLFRHIMEREVDGKVFEAIPPEVAAVVGFDKVYVLAEAAWRAVAALELEIETQEARAPGEMPVRALDSFEMETLAAGWSAPAERFLQASVPTGTPAVVPPLPEGVTLGSVEDWAL